MKYAGQLMRLCVTLLLLNGASAYALAVPDVGGTWTGSVTGNEQNCQDSDDNGPYSFSGFLTVNVQNGQQFSGFTSGVESSTFTCTILPDNSFTCMGNCSGPGYSGIKSSTGSVTGNTFTAVNMFQDTVGDTCNGTENISATRAGSIPPPIVIGGNNPFNDVNGDGRGDLIWWNSSTGVVNV